MRINTLTKNTQDFSSLKNIVYTLGEIVRANLFSNLEVQEKSGKELVTWLDGMIEDKAKQLITEEFGKVNYLGEELGEENNGSEVAFIIDPLDGTESFINREFNTTISIGVEIAGKLQYGIVYDFMKDMLYEGGGESKLYFQSKEVPLLRENYSEQTRIVISGRGKEVEEIQKKLSKGESIRITRMYGSVALQMAQTGAGNYDGYIRGGKVKTWDIAGSTPFIEGLNDTEILARDGSKFDYTRPEDGLIVVRKSFKDAFLKIIC